MSILTVEGVVENGQVRLPDDLTLPDKTTVYVVIPEIQTPSRARIFSPHLVHPDQAADFVKQVTVEAPTDGEL